MTTAFYFQSLYSVIEQPPDRKFRHAAVEAAVDAFQKLQDVKVSDSQREGLDALCLVFGHTPGKITTVESPLPEDDIFIWMVHPDGQINAAISEGKAMEKPRDADDASLRFPTPSATSGV
ncbi:MAG: hypothetical protein V1760_03200 [Candidatus Peregrinibacteria bacterium]